MYRAGDIDPNRWVPADEAVLCFIRDMQSRQLLLIHKKTGLGAGLINVPGGKIESGETPSEAAVRETQEEVGLKVENLKHSGELYFQFIDGYSIRGSVFETHEWSGHPVETHEAAPFWCTEREIPYKKMWIDDSWWIPHLLSGCRFLGKFVFDGQSMLSMCMEVESGTINGIPGNFTGGNDG